MHLFPNNRGSKMRMSSCNSSIAIKFAVNTASAKNKKIAVAVVMFGSCNGPVNYEDL